MARRRQPADSWRITVVESSHYDNRNRVKRRTVKNPTWKQVRTAILSLAAARHSGVAIVAADGSSMVIAGGLGRFTIATQCGQESQTIVPASLIDPTRGDDQEEIIVGGCRTLLPGRYIVDEEKTFRAARCFYQDGGLEPSLEWEPY